MDFFRYKDIYNSHLRNAFPHHSRDGAYLEFVKLLNDAKDAPDEKISWIENARMESRWHWLGMPYYKLYPWVEGVFSRFTFDIDCGSIPAFQCSPLCVRFAELDNDATNGVMAFLVRLELANSEQADKFGWATGTKTLFCHVHEATRNPYSLCLVLEKGTTVNQAIERRAANPSELSRFQQDNLGTQVIKIILGLALLANDPSIIQPDVLAKDRRRFDESDDPELRQRLIEKARKRGVVGWRIGEKYESIPHYRRPHPALYHVGKGRKEKRIVFRSGSVVHRSKLTRVPTGYITPDGKEVEPE